MSSIKKRVLFVVGLALASSLVMGKVEKKAAAKEEKSAAKEKKLSVPEQILFPETLTGDVEAGKKKYATAGCITCHEPEGKVANKALGGPKLAGQADWYLTRSLKKFQTKVRGDHKHDIHGKQMYVFVAGLTDQEIADLAAYLSQVSG